MTSLRQIEANRRNATKSTGPQTPHGKAVVALNAVQHGILSRQAVIQGESEAELGKRLRGQLAPIGELELLLAVALETLLFNTEHSLAYRLDRDSSLPDDFG